MKQSREQRLREEALRAIEGVFIKEPNAPKTATAVAQKTNLPRTRIQPIMEELARQKVLHGHHGDGERIYIAEPRWLNSLAIRLS